VNTVPGCAARELLEQCRDGLPAQATGDVVERVEPLLDFDIGDSGVCFSHDVSMRCLLERLQEHTTAGALCPLWTRAAGGGPNMDADASATAPETEPIPRAIVARNLRPVP